ncbi:hypothetical protein C883_3318 [Bacillus stratosphericus LAMA 585]|nr:hypothetical protein C883_3318 [Bacillus stratosphericus LAMA 585]
MSMIPVDPLASLDIFGQQRISIQEPHLTKSHIVDTLRLQKKRNDVNKQDAKFPDVFAFFSKKRAIDKLTIALSCLLFLFWLIHILLGEEMKGIMQKQSISFSIRMGNIFRTIHRLFFFFFLHHILSPPFQ